MNDEPVTNTPSSESIASPDLEKFVFNADVFTKEIVPRKLDAAEVAKFLLERIDEKTSLKVFLQVEKVAVFYDTFEVAEKFKTYLNKGESGEESVRRSIVIARIIARVGKAEEVDFARRYYLHLVSKVESLEEFEEIIFLHDALKLGANPPALKTRIQDKIKSLEAKQEGNEEARIQYLEMQGKIEQLLERAEKAAQVKDQILNAANRKKRMEEEIKAYLGIEYGFLEFLQPWAAARLRRETWATEPAQQIVRETTPALKADVAKAFEEFLAKAEKLPFLADEEDKKAAQIQILRAIKFFDGTISEQQENFLEQYKGEQADILANEGFQLP